MTVYDADLTTDELRSILDFQWRTNPHNKYGRARLYHREEVRLLACLKNGEYEDVHFNLDQDKVWSIQAAWDKRRKAIYGSTARLLKKNQSSAT